jgi:hypothetical protein
MAKGHLPQRVKTVGRNSTPHIQEINTQMRVPQPHFGSMPKHEMEREIGLMGESELQRALNQPGAYEVGQREKRAISKELGWRHKERMMAAQAHDDHLRNAGFDTGISVDITEGVPDPIADPLPDPVVNHVDDVTFGDFRPKEVTPLPEQIVTPDTSPLDSVPFADYDSTKPKSINESNDGISVKFEVQFNDGFNSKFKTK